VPGAEPDLDDVAGEGPQTRSRIRLVSFVSINVFITRGKTRSP
jgi:hypothetical protein